MSQFKLVLILNDSDWEPFNTMLADRRMTIDCAHQWLKRRGYQVGRTAVANYLHALRSGSLNLPAFSVAPIDAVDARRKLHQWIDRLPENKMAGLATFAGFVLSRTSKPVAFERASKPVQRA